MITPHSIILKEWKRMREYEHIDIELDVHILGLNYTLCAYCILFPTVVEVETLKELY
jgi:hypothetical protein